MISQIYILQVIELLAQNKQFLIHSALYIHEITMELEIRASPNQGFVYLATIAQNSKKLDKSLIYKT